MEAQKIPLIVAFLLCFFCTSAQDPYYFVLGASEFKNADIYSILHTKNQKLYVSTSEGLYEYKHGEMYPIEKNEEQRDVSLFNLIENSKNEVFCFNLNGQIFKIENQKLKLYFQFPKKFIKDKIEMFFDDMDRLIVSSAGCYSISDNGFEEIFYSKSHQNLKLSKLLNGDIILCISYLNQIIKIKNGQAQKLVSDWHTPENHRSTYIFELNNKYIGSDQLRQLYNSYFNKARPDEFFQYYQISKNEIWSRSNISGIKVIKSLNDSIYIEKEYFPNTFISRVTIDSKNTVFLGTFGKGLFVIPNQLVSTYNNIIPGNNYNRIAADEANIFISDIVEGILVYNQNNNKVDVLSTNRPTGIFTLEKNKRNLYKSYPNLFHGSASGTGDIKNIYEIDSSTFLIAASNGLFKSGNSPIVAEHYWKDFEFEKNADLFISAFFNKRCTDVAYDKSNQALYVSTMSFLKVLKKEHEILELSFKGFPIIANDLLFENGLLWCATQNFGILIFQDNKIVEQINTDSGLGNNFVAKIEKVSDHLYISHRSGFQIYSIPRKEWTTIGTAEGVENGTVKDFCIQNDKIWFISNNKIWCITNKKILSYSLNNIRANKNRISIDLDSIRVNNKKVSNLQNGNFKYYENDFSFFTSYNGLLYESEVELKYILEDAENNEIIQSNSMSISDKFVEFNYLPDGKYKFYIIGKYRDFTYSSESYTFTINKAFWQSSWFILLVILIITTFIGLFIKQRTKKIRKENLIKLEKQTLKTEAIQAELKALRSQMNPHFIFNSLNSIQDLILKEDTDASYDYLVLFSELVRNALVYSNQNLISIEKEILFLQSYLKLEKLRFGSEFQFSISNKVPNGLVIPSLVIQPFVENAIAHGIFHKKGQKLIDIKLFATQENLVCTIEDNGRGREFSKKIRAGSANKHKSFALDAILKRLQFLKVEYGDNIGFDIDDIIENQKLIGTKVTVRLPLIEKTS